MKVRKQGQKTPKVVAEDLVYDYNKPVEHVYVHTLNLQFVIIGNHVSNFQIQSKVILSDQEIVELLLQKNLTLRHLFGREAQ